MRKFINLSVRAPKAANYFEDSNSKERADKHSKATNYKVKAPKCSNCSEGHTLFQCERFLEMTPAQQVEELKIKCSLCFNCLSADQRLANCMSKSSCKTCRKRYHTRLHNDSKKKLSEEIIKPEM